MPPLAFPRPGKPVRVETRGKRIMTQKPWSGMSLDRDGLTEKEIHKAVFDHWRARGIKGSGLYTIPNGGSLGQTGLTPGLPDILVFASGGFHAGLELKRQGGRASLYQIAMQDAWRKSGHIYEICFGLDAALRQLEAWEILRRGA